MTLQTEIKYSLITFLGIVLFYTVLYFLPQVESPENSRLAYGALLIPVATIYLGIKERKDKFLKGEIDFAKAFATGLIITIFYSTLVGMLLAVAWPWLDLQLTPEIVATERARLTGEGFSPAEVNESIRQLKGMTSRTMQTMQTFMSNLISGMLISLVVAFIIKRPEYPD